MDIGTCNAVLELSRKYEYTKYSLCQSNKWFMEFSAIKAADTKVQGEIEWLSVGVVKDCIEGPIKKQQNILNKSLTSFINKVKKIKIVRKEIRPWGFYSVVLTGEKFLVKYLFVNPLSCTSKQFHHYRDEYHIILSGTGHINLNDKVYVMVQNHAIEIPRNVPHRIENKNVNTPLEIVEFQIGEYLSDNDIIRLDDIYGRTEAYAQLYEHRVNLKYQ